MKISIKLNPVKLLVGYALLHWAVTFIILEIVPGYGGKSFEMFAISLGYFYLGCSLIIFLSIIIFWRWSIRNWWVTAILLVIAFKPLYDYISNASGVWPWEVG